MLRGLFAASSSQVIFSHDLQSKKWCTVPRFVVENTCTGTAKNLKSQQEKWAKKGMRKISRKLINGLFVTMVVALCITSCGRDDNEGGEGSGNGMQWVPAKKLKKIEACELETGRNETYSINFAWNGDCLTEISYVTGNSELWDYWGLNTNPIIFNYNNKNQLVSASRRIQVDDEEVVYETKTTWDGNYIKTEDLYLDGELDMRFYYHYSNGKLQEISSSDPDGDAFQLSVSWSGNNIAKIFDFEEVTEYTYDDKHNPLHIPVGFYTSLMGMVQEAPFLFNCWSENNVVSFKDDNVDVVTYDYTYDEDGFPLTVEMSNPEMLDMRYKLYYEE